MNPKWLLRVGRNSSEITVVSVGAGVTTGVGVGSGKSCLSVGGDKVCGGEVSGGVVDSEAVAGSDIDVGGGVETLGVGTVVASEVQPLASSKKSRIRIIVFRKLKSLMSTPDVHKLDYWQYCSCLRDFCQM